MEPKSHLQDGTHLSAPSTPGSESPAVSPGERFRRFAESVIAVPKDEYDRELSAVQNGKPLPNPFAPPLRKDAH